MVHEATAGCMNWCMKLCMAFTGIPSVRSISDRCLRHVLKAMKPFL